MSVLHRHARRRRQELRPRPPRRRPRNLARRGGRGLTIALVVAAGCGEAERYTPEADHAAEVERNPYALTCGDIATQSKSSTSQRMVIGVEFALADEPALRGRVESMTENRVGRSIYWAMTELCNGADAAFTPGEQAVAAVRQGKYLVQPRPESWNRPPATSD